MKVLAVGVQGVVHRLAEGLLAKVFHRVPPRMPPAWPGRNRTPAEEGRDSRIAVRAIRRPLRTAVMPPTMIEGSQLPVGSGGFGCMTTEATTKDTGHARYTFRVRVSNTARRQLEAEWDHEIAAAVA
jgi:hypothetical protein